MIKRINPFMIVGLLFVILAFLWLGVQSKKIDLEESKSFLSKYEVQAKNLKELKKVWDSKDATSKLDFIISNLNLTSKATIKTRANILHVEVVGLDKTQVDQIVKKVLNEMFEIKKINIKRIDDKTLDFDLEVKK